MSGRQTHPRLTAALTACRAEERLSGITSGATLFIAHHQESWGIPGDHGVSQQHVQEFRHIPHFLLEAGAVHHKHDPSGATGGGHHHRWSNSNTRGHSNRWSWSHLAADLNFSRYWCRRLSCPGRSIRVQVFFCPGEGG